MLKAEREERGGRGVGVGAGGGGGEEEGYRGVNRRSGDTR